MCVISRFPNKDLLDWTLMILTNSRMTRVECIPIYINIFYVYSVVGFSDV